MANTETDRGLPVADLETLTLRVLYSGDEGIQAARTLVLSEGSLWIGRAASSGRTGDPYLPLLTDRLASERHARLHLEAGEVTLYDLQSRNKTYRNGHAVSQSPLGDGDLIRVGKTLLLLRRQRGPILAVPEVPFIVESPMLREVVKKICTLARSPDIVLLHGETGVGKEVLARLLHEGSGRPEPFMAVNCAAIPPSLAESELFGHTAHAFTGSRGAPGYFRAAGEGTLLLDEIGDMRLDLQAKLLRVLEERRVTPVGGTQSLPVRARIVAATHQDLLAAVQEGRFRADLYGRLNAAVVKIPPLRLRREEILPILFATFDQHTPPRLTPRLVEALLLYEWPFNVRELIKLGRVLRLHAAEYPVLDLPLVAEHLGAWAEAPPAKASADPAAAPAESSCRPEVTASAPPIELAVLDRLLREHQGVLERVAQTLGRSRRQIRRWMDAYGLHRRSYIK